MTATSAILSRGPGFPASNVPNVPDNAHAVTLLLVGKGTIHPIMVSKKQNIYKNFQTSKGICLPCKSSDRKTWSPGIEFHHSPTCKNTQG